jgi:dihydrolipoamide dehydrogenase
MPDYDLIIIGSGPGGYVAAIRASQLGLKTAVVEEDELGGVCLNWGCIPSKSLLRNAEVVSLFKRAEEFGVSVGNMKLDYGKAIDRSRQVVKRLTSGVGYLMKKNKVDVIKGRGVIVGTGTVQVGQQQASATNIIIATGARARSIPPLPVDGKTIITCREALELRDIPSRVAIVGGGAIGVEFATVYASYGSDVTIIEMMPRILPNEDIDISQQLESTLSSRGMKLMTDARVEGFSSGLNGATLNVGTKDGQVEIEADIVLVAIGIQGNIEDIGLEEVGVTTERGFIRVNDGMQTSVPGIYAIGDVTGKLALAHVASAQGVMVVERLAGKESPSLDYTYMPRATYCSPQVASTGLTEQQAKEQDLNYNVGKFPLSANGKAIALAETEGLVKIVADAETGEVIGAHMVGHEVTEMLGELSLANLLEGTTPEIGWLVHAHPTVSEALKEAALAVDGQVIHS